MGRGQPSTGGGRPRVRPPQRETGLRLEAVPSPGLCCAAPESSPCGACPLKPPQRPVPWGEGTPAACRMRAPPGSSGGHWARPRTGGGARAGGARALLGTGFPPGLPRPCCGSGRCVEREPSREGVACDVVMPAQPRHPAPLGGSSGKSQASRRCDLWFCDPPHSVPSQAEVGGGSLSGLLQRGLRHASSAFTTASPGTRSGGITWRWGWGAPAATCPRAAHDPGQLHRALQ